MLTLDNIQTYYGNIHALKGISLDVKHGEIVTIIGANGAGKTTVLKTICGLVTPSSGKVMFENNDITGKAVSDIVEAGIAMVPEGRRIFPRMTILENLQLGAYLNKDRKAVKNDLEKVFNIFPILKDRIKQIAGTLSGGEQQMLAIGRALMSRPKLMLLDEPSMGLAPKIVEEIFELILKIRDTGKTVLLIEQNASMALSIADRGYVLETGHIRMTGTGQELLTNDDVKKTYLGQ